MRIDKIRIKNYRCFADKTFEFPEQFSVVIGENGSGKTALLDALSVALGSYFINIDRIPAINIAEDDVRRVEQTRLNIEWQLPVEIETFGRFGETMGSWTRKKEKIDGKTQHKGARWITEVSKLHQERVRDNQPVSLPVFAYHGTGRLWAEHNEKIDYLPRGSRFDGYKFCLSPKSSSKFFLSWYKTMEDEMSKFNRQEEVHLLEAFKKAITGMVTHWEDISFSRLEDDLVGVFHGDDGSDSWFPYRMLSDGYRNLIGMVADIAYRCIRLNPQLLNNSVQEAEGIVLIDELDLHIHPKWQKEIVSNLKTVFPKLQFIVTTHSPFIIQSLKSAELIKLDNDSPSLTDPFRQSIEEIAADEMQVPNVERSKLFEQMQNIASEYYNLLKLGKSASTDEDIRQLKEKLDEFEALYGDDPAYVALLKAEREANLPGNN